MVPIFPQMDFISLWVFGIFLLIIFFSSYFVKRILRKGFLKNAVFANSLSGYSISLEENEIEASYRGNEYQRQMNMR